MRISRKRLVKSKKPARWFVAFQTEFPPYINGILHGGVIMLVLTRKEGEKIRIGDDIVVTVVRTGNDKVRLGIEAPSETVILRSELQETKKEEAIPFASVEVARCS